MESESMTLSSLGTEASMLPPATGSTNINVGPAERILSTFVGAATAVYGMRHLGSLGGLSLALTGSLLLYRGLTGYCMVNNAMGRNSNVVTRKTRAMEIGGTFTVNKPRAEVYAFWRKLENLPLFMKHLEEVKEEDSVNSVWTARVPGGFGTVSWKAVITEDRPLEFLTWTTQPGSTIDNAGEVSFSDASAGGTEIKVCITYRLPAGDVGAIAGRLFNPAIEKMMRGDLRRFKNILDTDQVNLPGSTDRITSGAGVESSAYPSPAQEYERETSKRMKSSRKPGQNYETASSRDMTLKTSPSNDSSQPTEKHL